MIEKRPWLPDEDAYILSNWDPANSDKIAEHLGRTVAAVKNRAVKLRATEPKPPRWTPEELQLMRDLWGERTLPQIAKRLGRSVTAVHVKGKRMKLGNFGRSSEYLNVREVSSLMGIDGHAVSKTWIAKYGLKARRIAPKGKFSFTYIRFDDLLEWLREHPARWDSRKLELYALGEEPEWLQEKRKQDLSLPTRRFQKWTPIEDQHLVQMYRAGHLSSTQIGEQLGRSKGSVYHRLKQLDVWGTGRRIGA